MPVLMQDGTGSFGSLGDHNVNVTSDDKSVTEINSHNTANKTVLCVIKQGVNTDISRQIIKSSEPTATNIINPVIIMRTVSL